MSRLGVGFLPASLRLWPSVDREGAIFVRRYFDVAELQWISPCFASY